MGMGCEDPRVTFLPALDLYLMGYTAYGAQGPRIAFAWSHDAYEWHRLGLCQFPERYRFFSRRQRRGILSRACALALRHSVDCLLPSPDEADCYTRRSRQYPEHSQAACGYRRASASHMCHFLPCATIYTLSCNRKSRVLSWRHPINRGRVKVGGGTAPVRISEGWLSLYHGVDALPRSTGGYSMRYSAGLVIHDYQSPHLLRYRSETPLFSPETEEELKGTVNNVVFPTALIPRIDLDTSANRRRTLERALSMFITA